MTDVRLIAAVGRRGQLGMRGVLPWFNPEDLKWFRQQTWGHVVVIGRKTSDQILGLPNRTMCVVSSRAPWTTDPQQVISRYYDRVIFVAGGEMVYRTWMPFVQRAIITLVDYDGESDTWMPSLWSSAK